MRATSFAVAVAATVLAARFAPVAGKQATAPRIEPGPTVMSSREKAIVADPAGGVQHGVILVTETERDDNKGTGTEITHHLRAKILSLEGRGLGDIAIPVEHGNTSLKTWWGRTILPDGTVVELPREALVIQEVVKSVTTDYREIRGALPGIVPGCVIDYGYVVRQDGFSGWDRVYLQTEWPVRSFQYRWIPNSFMTSAYVASRAEGLSFDVKGDTKSVLVKGNDLAAVTAEPLMPPLSAVRGSVTFYYTTRDKPADFWDAGAERTEAALKRFLGSRSVIQDAVASIGIPPEAPLTERLTAAYDWLGANVRNRLLMTAEEQEARDESEDDTYNARTVLRAKQGSPRQLDFLYAGMARALGAEANIVYAVDRTENFWNQALKSFEQFRYSFVAVRDRGAPESATVLVDAGSGLPYGQLPWRATGVDALMCSDQGRAIAVPPGSPATNRADTHVTVSFSPDNESVLIKWIRTANGATGLESRRSLRNLDVRQRKETLDELCGATGQTEVVTADLPGLDQSNAPFRIACDLEMTGVNVSDDSDRYSMQLHGPWWPETVDFPAAKRVHPVVFDYPSVDFVVVDVTAPDGFKPKDPPEPVTLDSLYGRYRLSITKTSTGFRVDRSFARTVLFAATSEYGALRTYFAAVARADQTALTFERGGRPE